MDHPTSYITEAMLTELFERCIRQRLWARHLQASSAELRVYTDQLRSEVQHRKACHRSAALARARARSQLLLKQRIAATGGCPGIIGFHEPNR